MPLVTINGKEQYVTQDQYDLLRSEAKRSDDGDFILSAVVGAVTGSSILGGLIGGDFTGGLLGDLLEGTDDSIF